MKKKGFTIVELISVIVVLTIIILIAIPAYSSIQNSINKKNRDNEIGLIQVAAEKYAEDYNVTAVFVKDLIDAGYIDPNDGNSIKDPTDKNIVWDCSIVTITTTKDIREAKFNPKSYKLNDSNVCDYNRINDLNGTLKIIMSDSKGEITKDTNYWTNENVTLTLKLNDVSKSFDGASIIWYKGSQEISGKTGTTIVVSGINNSILTQKYQAKVTLSNSSDTYITSVIVQIDKVKPEFYSNDGVKDGSNSDDGWLTETTYKAKAYDTGSGLYGYAIVRDDNETIKDCASQTYTKADSMKITENGKYAICLRDAAGNVTSSPRRYTLQYIDKIKSSDISAGLIITALSGNKVGNAQWYIGGKSESSFTLSVSALKSGASGLIYTLNAGASNTNLLYPNNRVGAYAIGDTLTKTYTNSTDQNGVLYKANICSKAKQCSKVELPVYYEKKITNAGTVTLERPSGAYDKIKATVTGASATSNIKQYIYNLYNTNGYIKSSPATTSSTYTFEGLQNKDNSITYYVDVQTTSNAGNVATTNKPSILIPGYCTAGQTKEPVITYTAKGDYYGCTNVCGGGTKYKDADQNTKIYSKYADKLCSDVTVTAKKHYIDNCGGTSITESKTTWNGGITNKCTTSGQTEYGIIKYKSTETGNYECNATPTSRVFKKTVKNEPACTGGTCPACSDSGSAVISTTKTVTYTDGQGGTCPSEDVSCNRTCNNLPSCFSVAVLDSEVHGGACFGKGDTVPDCSGGKIDLKTHYVNYYGNVGALAFYSSNAYSLKKDDVITFVFETNNTVNSSIGQVVEVGIIKSGTKLGETTVKSAATAKTALYANLQQWSAQCELDWDSAANKTVYKDVPGKCAIHAASASVSKTNVSTTKKVTVSSDGNYYIYVKFRMAANWTLDTPPAGNKIGQVISVTLN